MAVGYHFIEHRQRNADKERVGRNVRFTAAEVNSLFGYFSMRE